MVALIQLDGESGGGILVLDPCIESPHRKRVMLELCSANIECGRLAFKRRLLDSSVSGFPHPM